MKPTTKNQPATIVAFGETAFAYLGSTGSVIDRYSYTWPFLLEQQLQRHGQAVVVRNSLVVAEPIARAGQRLECDCLELRPDVVLVHVGQTDARLTVRETPRTPLSEFRRGLERILARIKRAGARAVLLTPTPFTISCADCMQYTAHQEGGPNVALERYVQTIRGIAARQKAPLLDLFSLFPKQRWWEELLFNGASPNRAGSRLIAAELARILPSVFERRRASVRSPNWTSIVAHGDSVTHSLGVRGVDVHAQTWRRLLERRLQAAGQAVVVRDSGIPCDRVVQAAARFQADVLARRPAVVLICFGLNDGWIKGDQKPVLSVRLYGQKLREMVRAAKRNGTRPVLVSPNPMTWVYYTNYFQRPVYKEKGVNCQLAALTKEMARVAQAERVGFVDLFQTFQAHRQWNGAGNPLVADGLHPSAAGNRLWAATLADYLSASPDR